jgi:hypothetical protein
MTIGLNSFRDEQSCLSINGMLMIPFRGKSEDYAINRRSHGRPDRAG